MSTGKCKPIGKDVFRIMRIIALEPTITCELVQQPTNNPQAYHALSYAWGTQPASEIILCDGEEFSISRHLYDGIISISLLYGFLDLWIDAICINQQDDKEKAMQVSIMNYIYEQALSVYVWLGVAENNSDAVVEFISSHERTLEDQKRFGLMAASLELPDGHMLNNLTEALVQPIWAFCTRTWFSRLWVVQEITLARRVDFICGLKAINGDVLTSFARAIYQGNFKLRAFSLFQIFLTGDLEGFVGLAYLQDLKASSSIGRPMFTKCVDWCRTKQVKEPVDRIYGLLSLCKPSDVYSQALLIDYGESSKDQYWQLYAEYGKIALLHEPKLRLLSTTSSELRPSALPSWCPNLNSNRAELYPMSEYFAGWPRNDHVDSSESSSHISLCSLRHPGFTEGSGVYVSTSSQSNEIEIRGCVLDQVAEIAGGGLRAPDFQNDSTEDWKRACSESSSWLMRITDMARHVYGISDIPEALWRTLVGDFERTKDGNSWPCSPKQQDHFKLLIKYYNLLIEDIDRLIRGEEPTGAAATIINENKDDFEQMFYPLPRIWTGRVFFTTKNGRIGFASKKVQTGDSICAFYSGPTLYFLREVSAAGRPIYNFISDGYVHGLMKGEAFDLLDSGESVEQQFTIV